MSMAPSTASPKEAQVFSDDDEETWKMLVSQDIGDDVDISPLLSGLATRIQEDWFCGVINTDHVWGDGEQYWKDLVSDLSQKTTFIYSDAASQQLSPRNNLSTDKEIPAAFQTEAGQRHIFAAAALLGLTEDRAVEVTLGALRSIDVSTISFPNGDGKKSDFASLLGTRDLLIRCMVYHYQQRLARLSALTECMRLEVDPDTRQHAAVEAFLDSLDSIFSQTVITGSEKKTIQRGIFKSLLIVACRPDPRPNLASLEPSKKLLDPCERFVDNSFDTFAATIIAENKKQAARERTQAMEGILALLYGDRIQGGMMRCDYGLLISAAFDFDNAPTRRTLDSRWKHLVGLVCAESVSLLKTMEAAGEEAGRLLQDGTAEANSRYLPPMLIGLDTPVGMAEMESLINIWAQVTERYSSTTWIHETERTESVAVLSFGFLLQLAKDFIRSTDIGTRTLETIGGDFVMLASDKGDAFDSLAMSLSFLTGSTLARRPSFVKRDSFYDWQLSSQINDKGEGCLIMSKSDSQAAHSLPADVVTYTCIAQEVIGAAISLYRDSILSIDSADAWRKIGIMCHLVAVVSENNAVLCDQFWNFWDAYSQSDKKTVTAFPMCHLFDASYDLAILALNSFPSNQITSDSFMKFVSPFLRLFSTLCYTSDLVEKFLSDSVCIMLQTALCCCSSALSTTNAASDDTVQVLVALLQSFATLTRIADGSKSCLDRLRTILENESSAPTTLRDGRRCPEGPGLLAAILSPGHNDNRIICAILQSIGHLLTYAPSDWVVEVASRFLAQENSTSSKLNSFVVADNVEVSNSAVAILAALIGHFDAFCFEKLLRPTDAVAYLQAMGSCINASLCSLAWNSNYESPLSLQAKDSVLHSCAAFLKWTRPLLSAGEELANGATIVRDSLIRTLASDDVCTGIVYYAVAPVSTMIALKMEEEMRDADILDRVFREGDAEGVKKYGAWAFLSSSKNKVEMNEELVKRKVLSFLSTMSIGDIDFAAIRSKGWLSDGDDYGQYSLNASWAALRLLSEWASHVEDIARSHQEDLSSVGSPLSSKAADIIRDLSPQRSLCSFAPAPLPCRSNGSLDALWRELRLSTFDLLLTYLSPGDLYLDSDRKDLWQPTSVLLDFFNASILQCTSLGVRDMLEELPLVRALSRSQRFILSLADLLKQGLNISETQNTMSGLCDKERESILCAFFSLRVLGSLAALNTSSPTSSFDATLLDILEKASSSARELIETGGKQHLLSESAVLQMRFASASIDVLASISEGDQSSPGWSALSKYCARDSVYMTQLTRIIRDYCNSSDVDETGAEISTILEHGRVSIVLFVTSSLRLYKALLVAKSQEDEVQLLSSEILKQFDHSRKFLLVPSFSLSAQSRKFFRDTTRDAGLATNPMKTMLSFPTTSSSILSRDYYQNENSFDQRSLCQWYGLLTAKVGENRRMSLTQVLDELSCSHSLVAGELAVMESWADLLKIVAYNMFRKNEFALSSSNATMLMRHSQDTLQSLYDNLKIASQCASNGCYMNDVIVRMSKCLGRLLRFLLELGALDSMPLDGLLGCLGLLTDSMDYLYNITSPIPGDESTDVSDICCDVEQVLLGSCLILVGLIEEKSPSDHDQNAQRDAYTKLCLTTCRFVQSFTVVGFLGRVQERDDSATICLCAAVLTHIVLTQSRNGTLRSIAAIMKEHETPKQLMLYASFFSTTVSQNMAFVGNAQEVDRGDQWCLSSIKAVFNLLHAISGVMDVEVLSTLPELEFSHLVVRNPLFESRAPLWHAQDPSTSPPRGYVFKGEMAMISNQKASLLVGTDDPIFNIWLIAMKILAATTQTYSRQMQMKSVDGDFKFLFDIPVEFLRIHRLPLLACLKSCDDKLTRNALNEATAIFAMVAALCACHGRGIIRHASENILLEFVENAKFVVSTLSKFLGATGNSQELFMAIHEHESTDEDGFDLQAPSPFVFARDRLVSEGLSSVKHEAIKFSHYASGRVGRITKGDFEASAVVPHHLKQFSIEYNHENDLERNCRLAVTSNFSLELVRNASECLCQALSLIWRSHSINSSYYLISDNVLGGLDLLRLVKPGLLVGYRPNIGECMLDDPIGFSSLRFGTVVDSNTFDRTWEVQVIQWEGSREAVDGIKEIMRPEQLVGIEDTSARKPASRLEAAPDVMESFEVLPSSLSTANYIMILRWCHQQFAFGQGQALTNGFELPRTEQQIAEEAAILLAADLVLHTLNGDFECWTRESQSSLNAQIFELFADKEIVILNAENDPFVPYFKEGRLKDLISTEVWRSIQRQVAPFVQQAWSEKLEANRLQKEMKSTRRVSRSGYRLR